MFLKELFDFFGRESIRVRIFQILEREVSLFLLVKQVEYFFDSNKSCSGEYALSFRLLLLLFFIFYQNLLGLRRKSLGVHTDPVVYQLHILLRQRWVELLQQLIECDLAGLIAVQVVEQARCYSLHVRLVGKGLCELFYRYALVFIG